MRQVARPAGAGDMAAARGDQMLVARRVVTHASSPPSRPGRHGALPALAGRLPAPILAERLGIHQARAAQWARAAGATYAPYVRLRRSELRIMDEWREQALHGGRQTVVDPARALASARG